MPCTFISFKKNVMTPPSSVDLTIQEGTANHNDRGIINYWYEFSTGAYFIPASKLSSIPNGATINKIASLDKSSSLYRASFIDEVLIIK